MRKGSNSEVENSLPDNATTDRATAHAITLIAAAGRKVPSLVRSNIDIIKSVELEIGVPVLGPAVDWGVQFFCRAYLREQMDPTEGPPGFQALEGLRIANDEDWATPNYLFQWRLGSQD